MHPHPVTAAYEGLVAAAALLLAIVITCALVPALGL